MNLKMGVSAQQRVIKLATTPTPTRTRTQKGNLSQRSKALVTAHWTNLTRYLAPPVAAWTWGESGLREGLKRKLMTRGLIHKSVRVTGHWETSERLWMHVIEHAGDDVVGAEATGQLTLDLYADIPHEKSGVPRVEPKRNHVSRSVQESLDGGPVPVSDLQSDDMHPKFVTERWRDSNKKAAQHHEQADLTAWMPVDPTATWVVNPRSSAGLCIAGEAVF